MGLFVAGLFLFWLAAALRYRAASRDAEVPGGLKHADREAGGLTTACSGRANQLVFYHHRFVRAADAWR
jgi:hypothetical protein